MERLKADVNLDGRVILWWMDTDTSGTLKLTPDQAMEIGTVGRMAHERAKAKEEGK